MQRVTVTLSEETIDSLELVAAREYDCDRDAAASALLAEWIDRQ